MPVAGWKKVLEIRKIHIYSKNKAGKNKLNKKPFLKHVLGRDSKADTKVIIIWMGFSLSDRKEQHGLFTDFVSLLLDECYSWEQKWLQTEKQLSDTEKTSNAHSI